MARHRHRGDELRAQLPATDCTCSFCLLFFSMEEPSDFALRTYQQHLEAKHGLVLQEIER